MNNPIDNTPDITISAHRDIFVLDRSFILTRNKTLVKGMPYVLMEGSRTKAVRLLDFEVVKGTVDLIVQELETDKIFTLSWNLEYSGSYWLWSLADFPTLTNPTKLRSSSMG